MPKQETGGSNEEYPKDEAFDYGQLPKPVTEVDTQPLKIVTDKEHIKLLHEDIKKAKNIEEILNALYRHDQLRAARNLTDAMNSAGRLLAERPDTSQYTIEKALESSDIFKDKAFQTEYPYLDKKIRRVLVEYLKEKLLKQ